MGSAVERLWSRDNHTSLLFIAFAKPTVRARQRATLVRGEGAGGNNGCRIASPADPHASTSRELQNRDATSLFGGIPAHTRCLRGISIHHRSLDCVLRERQS